MNDMRSITSFNIYYSSHDPHARPAGYGRADQSLYQRESGAAATRNLKTPRSFSNNNWKPRRQNLAEQEEKVRVYKDQHLGELPSQLTSNVQILSGLQSQLQNEEDGLNADRQQNAYLQSMLEQSRALQTTTKSGDGAPVGIPALDQQLDKLKAQLADLLLALHRSSSRRS